MLLMLVYTWDSDHTMITLWMDKTYCMTYIDVVYLLLVMSYSVQRPCWSRSWPDFREISANNIKVEPKVQFSIGWQMWGWRRWWKISHDCSNWRLPSTSCFWRVTSFCPCFDKLWATNKKGEPLKLLDYIIWANNLEKNVLDYINENGRDAQKK